MIFVNRYHATIRKLVIGVFCGLTLSGKFFLQAHPGRFRALQEWNLALRYRLRRCFILRRTFSLLLRRFLLTILETGQMQFVGNAALEEVALRVLVRVNDASYFLQVACNVVRDCGTFVRVFRSLQLFLQAFDRNRVGNDLCAYLLQMLVLHLLLALT